MATTTTKRITKTAVLRLLRDLGDTADKVAASLGRRRIKGCRYGANSPCPIRAYLTRKLNINDVSVGPYGTSLIDTTIRHVHHPKAVKSFIGAFDHGDYPKLIATTNAS